MAADITEEFQVDISAVPAAAGLENASVSYDLIIGNLGFMIAADDNFNNLRETAQYRKEQSDSSIEPGEQSLTGWWLRSQSSFHLGAGTRFYEPAQEAGVDAPNKVLRFQYDDSYGVNPWEIGEVSLLPELTEVDVELTSPDHDAQPVVIDGENAVLFHDGYSLKRLYEDGTVDILHTETEGEVFATATDGTYAYWITNRTSGSLKGHLIRKPLNAAAGDASTVLSTGNGMVVSQAAMAWVKERIILTVSNYVFSIDPISGSFTQIYQSPSTGLIFTSIVSSPADIYISAVDGLRSFVLRVTLDTDGTIPVLSGAVVAAELPRGEIIQSMYYYLGYVLLGTSYGVRVAQIVDGGGIVFGPLSVHTDNSVYQFTADDSYVWAACGVGTEVGLVRLDLSSQVGTLLFPYANDLVADDVVAGTKAVSFFGTSDRLAVFGDKPYIQSDNLRESGWLRTGRIRYNTLENKLYKNVRERALYTANSSIQIYSVDKDGTEVFIGEKGFIGGNSESAMPLGAKAEFFSYKFVLRRDTVTATAGPKLYGYQVKALPAAPRQRLIQYVLDNFNTFHDRYNNIVGYEGYAFEKLQSLESLESNGDTVEILDNRTGERFTALIEEIGYRGSAPSDKRYNGFGGYISLTVRKL